MGQQDVDTTIDEERGRAFGRRVLRDLDALERMLAEGLFETGIRRLGAEQEFSLVDGLAHPAPVSGEILAATKVPDLVPELARFNLELNLDPHEIGGDCFDRLFAQLDERVRAVRGEAAVHGAQVVLAGILPTARLRHLGLGSLTPRPRYAELNERLTALRGGHHDLHIRGVDDLTLRHDSIMLESVNTSFQVHLQIEPDEFVRAYDAAQVLAAPVLATAANSPLFLGRRLWHETRVPLFRQSIDTRRPVDSLRSELSRVRFGERWVDSVLDYFRDDVTRLRSLCRDSADEDSMAELDAGRVPRLAALGMHNSTIYKWNRLCYGVGPGTDGREIAHLRVENRLLPSGPSLIDEVASAALWIGCMLGAMESWGDVRERIGFEDVSSNFTASARLGLRTRLTWLDGGIHSVHELVLNELIPLASGALERAGVDPGAVSRLLGVVEQRVGRGVNGAEWMLRTLRAMPEHRSRAAKLRTLVEAMIERQESGLPVAEWSVPGGASCVERGHAMVGDVMSHDLVTVHPEDAIELAERFMSWLGIHHMLVEDDEHRLVGAVDDTDIPATRDPEKGAVRDWMRSDALSVSPITSTEDAIDVMRREGATSVAVVECDRLVGILTMTDVRRCGLDDAG